MSESQRPTPFEDRLTAALRTAGDSFDADRAALAEGGQTRGRRARLRRRAGVLGGAAGIALVGVGGALLLPGGGHSAEPQGTSAAAPPSATAASPAPSASYSADDLLQALKKLLPEGEVSEEDAQGPGPGLPPYAHLVFDDGRGAAAVGISLDRVEPGSQSVRELTTCPDKTVVTYDDCTSSRLPDGSVLMVYQGYEYPDRRVDTKWWSAELVTARGQHVSVSEWNAPAEKDAAITRAQPPLSPDQLKKVATAGVWLPIVDAIPEDPKAAAREKAKASAAPSRAPEASGVAIGETLASLLPDGVDVVSRGEEETGYAYLVLDDGKGPSLVQINVQPGMSDVAGELYGSAETRPDGTLLATSQGPGEKGGSGVVMWTADTLRPSGLRVVVSAFNTGAQNEDATRDAPALTMEQLQEIALSEQWERLG
ncbi:hypothetical protein [Streptomyces sp. SID5910]|uniref:hypothetical protein n=1 Tax=Streptomyces sp. SID5910 TaxID=2690312 RepID=UPI00136B217F|nr:hypothetical protein [Streptomyces sp. SID5910]MYR41137.1 hypothetical protein [Streptomyces sp. SID5910]